ncbi:hypothetical protein BDZ89DRAFT_1092397 [Hymenopellis radicata]|nr:hypothetical protein BDZ89DRAFT_1092397 [Hymenopellis radicata]
MTYPVTVNAEVFPPHICLCDVLCTTLPVAPSNGSFPIVANGVATPIIISSEDWDGIHIAVDNFASDIGNITGIRPIVLQAAKISSATEAIIVGSLDKTSLISSLSGFNASSLQGQWEAFSAQVVDNPVDGLERAYVIAGSDKRGTIYALYEHSEQFGVSPWYWWADVPIKQQDEIFVPQSGCSHGPPTVQYRGIFLNDEEPALTNWALEKFTNGTGSVWTGSPFNHLFYVKLFELLLRLKGNYLWPGIAFAVDDPDNQRLADVYGIAMGTSHQEPMDRASPPEWYLFGSGPWNYNTNAANLTAFWTVGVERAKNYETVFTIGMRGEGDLPLEESTNIALLEEVIADQRQILTDVFGNVSITTIPQIWALYKEVETYYYDGLQVPDDVTLLWSDDNWGNIRRFPVESERNRSGGAGVYYHFDYVGDPLDYKWITVHEQMSIAVDRNATRLWIVNVGDMKPYEREIEFFLNYGWDASAWNPDNLDTFVTSWAQREFALSDENALAVTDIVANITRFNSRKKPELLNSTTYSLVYYREAETVMAAWDTLLDAANTVYNGLGDEYKPSFFQLVLHPMYIAAGLNNLRSSQAFLSTNALADRVQDLFDIDYELETQYHTLLDASTPSMMDQTHIGYFYWQQPQMNSLPGLRRVQAKKQALAGVMRIAPEGTSGAWPGDNPSQCDQGYNCPPPSVLLDSFDVFGSRFVDVGSGGPAPFTFNVSSNVSWLSITPTEGSISPDAPEQRVFASVAYWDALPEGDSYAGMTFTAEAEGQPSLSVVVGFVARNTKASLSSDFTGFVEYMGGVSMEAAHASRNNSVDDIFWKELPGIGRTVSGVTPWPREDGNFTAGSGPSLEYDFYTFTETEDTTAHVYVSPSLNARGNGQPLGFAVQIDSQPVNSSYFMPLAAPGTLPDEWGSFVNDSIVPVTFSFDGLSPGAHVLKLFMIESAVVVQKIVLDLGGLKPTYLGPPESLQV